MKQRIQIGTNMQDIFKLPCVRGVLKIDGAAVYLVRVANDTVTAREGDWLIEDQEGEWHVEKRNNVVDKSIFRVNEL